MGVRNQVARLSDDAMKTGQQQEPAEQHQGWRQIRRQPWWRWRQVMGKITAGADDIWLQTGMTMKGCSKQLHDQQKQHDTKQDAV